jgi:flagellar hook-length control protein FliK
MENSTSLRFLEASGRPSGTGRPSLPAPRADQERASAERKPGPSADARAARRKARPHEQEARAADPAQASEPKPFEKLLGDAKSGPAADEQPAKPRPHAKSDAAVAQQAGPQPIAEPLLPLPESSAPAAPAEPSAQPPQGAHAPGSRTDAQPPSAATAPAPAAATDEDAAQSEDGADAVETVSSSSGEPPLEALAGRAQAAARDGSLFAQPAPASEPRSASLAAAEARPPSALPEPAADSGRAGEILRQLRVQFSPELRSATIQLSPPELGRISIRMRIERGELHTLVRAERRETLAALQRHVPELKATLEQLGIQTRELDLQLGFEQRGARQDPQAPRADAPSGAGREHEPELREAQLLRTLSARSGGVDTYA